MAFIIDDGIDLLCTIVQLSFTIVFTQEKFTTKSGPTGHTVNGTSKRNQNKIKPTVKLHQNTRQQNQKESKRDEKNNTVDFIEMRMDALNAFYCATVFNHPFQRMPGILKNVTTRSLGWFIGQAQSSRPRSVIVMQWCSWNVFDSSSPPGEDAQHAEPRL